MSTDLALITESDLVIRDEDTGAPIAVRMPGGGQVSFDDLAGLALWARTIIDLEADALRPVKHLVGDAMNEHLNRRGEWTVHLDNGLTVKGESPGAGENATLLNVDALYADLLVLRERETSKAEAEQWAAKLFKVDRALKPAGRQMLVKLGGVYAETLASHTESSPRSQKRPGVEWSK